MINREELRAELTGRDAKTACAYAGKIVEESEQSNCFYPYWDDFAVLLSHKNSFVRNRAIAILAANARWDTENKMDALADQLLLHIADEKPITARQCIQALPKIAASKPKLIPKIYAALKNADLDCYRDSMRPLILKDILDALQKIAELEEKAERSDD